MGLEEPFAHVPEGPGIGALQEAAHLGIAQPLVTDGAIGPIRHAAGTGVVGEEVVQAGGHLEAPLVAVLLHGPDPAGVENPAAQHLVEFPLKPMHFGPAMARVVAKPEGRGLALQAFCCRTQASLELVVVVGIEQVVFPVVLVVQHHLHLPQPGFKPLAIGPSLNPSDLTRSTLAGPLVAVTPTAPVQKGFGQVAAALPLAAVDQPLEASAVGPRCRSIDPGVVAIHPGGGCQGIGFGRFIQASHQIGGLVHPAHELGEGVSKQSRDP